MDKKIARKLEILKKLLMYLGSKDVSVEYDAGRPEELRFKGILNDMVACIPVAGSIAGRPNAYGFSAKDVFYKIRACLPPRSSKTTWVEGERLRM